jgi:hypothetical protein
LGLLALVEPDYVAVSGWRGSRHALGAGHSSSGLLALVNPGDVAVADASWAGVVVLDGGSGWVLGSGTSLSGFLGPGGVAMGGCWGLGCCRRGSVVDVAVAVVWDVVHDMVGTERGGRDGALLCRPFDKANAGPQPSSWKGAHGVVLFIRVMK